MSRELFFKYREHAKQLGISPIYSWSDTRMREYIEYRTQHSILSLSLDEDNECGLITERTALRWVRDKVNGAQYIKVPLGKEDGYSIMRLSKLGISILNFEKIQNLIL